METVLYFCKLISCDASRIIHNISNIPARYESDRR